MLQRIQSLYLLIATGSVGLMLAFPFLTSNEEVTGSKLLSDQVFDFNDHVAIPIIFGIVALISLISIFLFKNRKLQLTLTALSLILIILGVGFLGFLCGADFGNHSDIIAKLQPAVGISAPFLMILFIGLARGGIKKDEALVRSANRLR